MAVSGASGSVARSQRSQRRVRGSSVASKGMVLQVYRCGCPAPPCFAGANVLIPGQGSEDGLSLRSRLHALAQLFTAPIAEDFRDMAEPGSRPWTMSCYGLGGVGM